MHSLWMVCATLLFSMMGVCVKLLTDDYSTLEIVMYRSMIGAFFLYAVVLARGGTLKTRFPAAHLWRAAVGATAFGLWFFSMRTLPIATAFTLNYTSPIWIAGLLFLAGFLRGHFRFEWRLVAAIVASFTGVVLVLQPTIAGNQIFSGLIALFSGFLAALAFLQVRHLGNLGEPEYRVVFYFCTISTVGAAVLCVLSSYLPGSDGVAFHAHSLRGAGLLLVVGIAAALGQMALTRAYHLGNTLVTANLQYTGIVFSSIWGIVVWGDMFGPVSWIGMAVILLSGVAATFFDVRRKVKDALSVFRKAETPNP